MKGMNSEKATERHREGLGGGRGGDLDIKWVLGLSTGPEVMEMGVCRYGTPRAPRHQDTAAVITQHAPARASITVLSSIRQPQLLPSAY